MTAIKNAASAEDKRTAMSGITQTADSYIAAIKSYYGTSVEGQKLMQQVVSNVSGLESMVSIQDLQLGVLQQIRDGVHELPSGLSDAQAAVFNTLAAKIDAAQLNYNANPTVADNLTADSYAKIWLSLDKAALSGVDGAFLTQLIDGITGQGGIISNIDLVLNCASLTSAGKESMLSSITTGCQFTECTH
jgi:hypothetical protein